MTAARRLLGAASALAVNLLGELVAPSCCAACDARIGPARLFCPACASTVVSAAGGATATAADRGRSYVAAFEYGGAIATAIARLKYRGRADLGPKLGAAMRPAAAPLGGAVDLVVPVPLHPRRLAERGYNQAALLGRPVAGVLGARFAARALVRVRDTPRQVSRDRESRIANVAGAFASRCALAGARVLLVDDVTTTGATLDGCARALHEAGATHVRALVLARRA